MTQDPGTSFWAVKSIRPAALLLAGVTLAAGMALMGSLDRGHASLAAGALLGVAVCIMSGRADWRGRVVYFAFFGALAWRLGACMPLDTVVAYVHSGDLASQVFGLFCLFLMGWIWAGLTSAAIAFPAVAGQTRVTKVMQPLLFFLVVWYALDQGAAYFTEWWAARGGGPPLRWLGGTAWLGAVAALAAACLHDLAARARLRLPLSLTIAVGGLFLVVVYVLALVIGPGAGALVLVAGAGLLGLLVTHPSIILYAYAGYYAGIAIQHLLVSRGWSSHIREWLLQYEGGNAAAHRLAEDHGNAILGMLPANWPEALVLLPGHLGWILGLAGGLTIFFLRNGRFAGGASLLVSMAAGWLICFLVGPVLLGFGGAGLRVAPDAGGVWAGMLGAFLGALWWLHRNQLAPAVWAGLAGGLAGGICLAGAQVLKLVLLWPGNAARGLEGAAGSVWAHWQGARWESLAEQCFGFGTGAGLGLVIGLLALSKGQLLDIPGRFRGVRMLALAFVLLVLPCMAVTGVVDALVRSGALPPSLGAPLFSTLAFSPAVWVKAICLPLAAVAVLLFFRHKRHPVELVPVSVLGRAQLLFLAILWILLGGAIAGQLPSFEEQRLLTEWLAALLAVVATAMVLWLPHPSRDVPETGQADYHGAMARTVVWSLVGCAVVAVGGVMAVRVLYGDNPAGHAPVAKRFGEDAAWRQIQLPGPRP